jgi:hypothetical protein
MHDQPSPRQSVPSRDVATLRQEVATLRREVARLRTPRRRRFRPLLAALALALLVALVPLGLLAANPFTDLDPASPHNANIDAIYNAGITKGCNPPAFDNYCPKDNVTREEMASFLARTAGLGTNPPVANALTAVNATNAANAANAAQLGGLPPSAYLPSSGDLTMRYPFYNLVPNTNAAPNVTLTNFTDGVGVSTTTTGTKLLHLPLDRPTGLFGLNLAVKSVEVCFYTDNATVSISQTSAVAFRDEGNGVVALTDATAHTGGTFTTAACYTVSATTPTAYGKALRLDLTLNFTTTVPRVILRSVALTLTPTTAGAAETGEPEPAGPGSSSR